MQLIHTALVVLAEKKEEEGTTVKNPFDGVSPDIAPLGNGFDNALSVILGVIWGLVLIYVSVKLLTSFISYSSAKKQGHYEELGDHTDEIKRRGIAVIAVAAFGVLIGAVLKVAGML